MNIGFDAKRMFKNDTGLGNYSRSLVHSLATLYPQNFYHLFTPTDNNKYLIKNGGNLIIHTPNNWWYKKLSSLWRRKGMVKDIVQNNVIIFHGLSNELPLGIEKKTTKTIVTIHDVIFERYPETYHFDERYVHRFKVKKACTIANAVIATSIQTKKDLIQYYQIPAAKIIVCYQSCNPIFKQLLLPNALASIKEKYKLPQTYFLFVSSITKRKNLITICKAMVQIKDVLNYPLVIIGNGKKEKEEVIRFMSSNGMLDKIIFLNDIAKAKNFGYVPNADLPAIYQMAKALIYPSFFEGFGIPLLEAMYSGLPVISSNTSSLPEVCEDAALYFNPTDVDTLCTHLLNICNNDVLYQSLQQKGFKQATKFTEETFAKSVMDVYINVLQNS
jgi:glycosyltransferase involved in cell wall biosynthesis